MQKLPEDAGLTGLMTDDDDSNYRQQIRDSADWCDENYLHFNVEKTTGIIAEYSETEIKGETVERVKMYKYLRITFDDKLS